MLERVTAAKKCWRCQKYETRHGVDEVDTETQFKEEGWIALNPWTPHHRNICPTCKVPSEEENYNDMEFLK